MWSNSLKTSTTTSSAKNPEQADASGEGAFHRMRRFTAGLKKGLHVEWHETRAVPGQLLRGEFRKAGEQVADLGRMGFLAALWVLPGGAILSGFVIKVFHRIRPSAFRPRRHGAREREEPCD